MITAEWRGVKEVLKEEEENSEGGAVEGTPMVSPKEASKRAMEEEILMVTKGICMEILARMETEIRMEIQAILMEEANLTVDRARIALAASVRPKIHTIRDLEDNIERSWYYKIMISALIMCENLNISFFIIIYINCTKNSFFGLVNRFYLIVYFFRGELSCLEFLYKGIVFVVTTE